MYIQYMYILRTNYKNKVRVLVVNTIDFINVHFINFYFFLKQPFW